MKRISIALLLVVLGSIASGPALAHVHGRIGIAIGVPLFWPWYYPPYYSPPIVVQAPPRVYVRSSPPVYVERRRERETDEPSGYWYYCSRPKGYYPYVKHCSRGWERVLPEPPSD